MTRTQQAVQQFRQRWAASVRMDSELMYSLSAVGRSVRPVDL